MHYYNDIHSLIINKKEIPTHSVAKNIKKGNGFCKPLPLNKCVTNVLHKESCHKSKNCVELGERSINHCISLHIVSL